MSQKQQEQARFSGAVMCDALVDLLRGLPNVNNVTLEGVVVGYAGVGDQGGRRSEPEIIDGLSRARFWMQGIQAFKVVVSAVSRSQARLNTLSIFQKTHKCGIPTNVLTTDLLDRLGDDGFERVGGSIQKLSLSVGTTVLPLVPPASRLGSDFYELVDLDEQSNEIGAVSVPVLDAHANLKGLTRFLSFMPSLESLEIQLYNSAAIRDQIPEHRPLRNLLRAVFSTVTLPHLKYLSLRGMPSDEQTLTELLCSKPGLQSLTLKEVYLCEGSWTEVLATLAERRLRLSRVHLRNLWQPGGQGPLHLESRCDLARRFDRKDPDLRRCWFGPARAGKRVWFDRVFAAEDIWELADVASNPTYGGNEALVGAHSTMKWMNIYLHT